MLDLTRVVRDLESPTYGAMSHVVDVLMRVIRADGAVGLCHEAPTHCEVVYISWRHGSIDPQDYNKLRKWPTDPLSGFWHGRWNMQEDIAFIPDPHDPADAKWGHEVSQMLSAPEVAAECDRCLCLSLRGTPICRILFLRLGQNPPFDVKDTVRVMRYSAKCVNVIQATYHRQFECHHENSTPFRLTNSHHRAQFPHLLNGLSEAENRVLQRLRLYETEKQVAKALGRSPNTVHVHVTRIYRKLHVNNRKQLLALFEEHHTPPVIQHAESWMAQA